MKLTTLALQLFFLCFIIAANAQEEENYTFLEYGFPMAEYQYQVRNEVASKWNIQYKTVGGCMVSDALMDSVSTVNQKTTKQLVKRYGKDWKERYDEEVRQALNQYKKEKLERDRKADIQRYRNDVTDQALAAVELVEQKTIYRGFPNKIKVSVSNNDGKPVFLQGENITISKSDSKNNYILKPGREKKATLHVYLINSDSLEHIQTVHFRVQNIPDPVAYWGEVRSGFKADTSSNSLYVQYPPEFSLNHQFEIVKWTFFAPNMDGAAITGIGNDISSAIDYIKNHAPLEGVSFNMSVRGPDGITRQFGGSWSL